LDEVIAGDLAAGDDGLAKALRQIVTAVTVMPAPAGEKPEIKIEGYLETLLKPTFEDRSIPGVSVVAGEGLEPPTPGL
jgi:hypothetical protein